MTWATIPAYHRSTGSNFPIQRAVVHCTVSPCTPGGARANARYFQNPASGGSAHRVVDPAEVVICAPDDVICWHAPPNRHSLSLELCDPMTGPASRWTDGAHVAMLRLGAAEMRHWCDTYGLPITHIEAPGLRQGLRGLTGHVDVSNAWRLSDHWDPGPYFPWGTFLGLVAGHITEEDAMSADTENMMRENWMRLIQQQQRQAAADRSSLATSVPAWYEFYLGRPASVAVVEEFMRRYDAGASLVQLEQSVRASAEARKRAVA